MFALVVVGVAAPSLHASTVTFNYTAANLVLIGVSGFGSFSYNGSLSSIGLSDLTSFAFQLDISVPFAFVNPATFDFTKSDLLSFSATVSGGAVTALSLKTDFESADNTGIYDETQKDLVVTHLGHNGAYDETELTVLNDKIIPFDIGTITTQGPAPEPSTALLAGGGAALLLAFWRRTLRAPRG